MATSSSFGNLNQGRSGVALALLVAAIAVASGAAENDMPASGVALDPVRTEAVFTNTIGMKFVRIPAGEFLMGRGETPDSLFAEFESSAKLGHFVRGERPQHVVGITRSFQLGIHEVTVGEFEQFVKDSGYKTDAEHDGRGSIVRNFGADRWEVSPQSTWRNPGFPQSDHHPVVCVSWNDAVVFCEWLTRKEKKTYRLPTEAEWEYACRAGTVTRFHHGDDVERVVQVANVFDSTAGVRRPEWPSHLQQSDGFEFTAPVGSFDPNAWGLRDMHGNALEWCQDRYAPDYYLLPPQRDDPQGPESGMNRVVRGGCYFFRPLACRSAFRAGHAPGSPVSFTGFRVVREP